jgi:transposase
MARHNKEMTTETKKMILRLKREGYAHREIAEIIERNHSTITKFLKRYNERNSVEDKPKTGRKKLVTERRRPCNLTLNESQQKRNYERFDKHCK